MKTPLFFLGLACGVIGLTVGIWSRAATVSVTELNTLNKMRYTAIQMTVLSLESEQSTNISNDAIIAEIYEYQQENETDRLTTIQIESLYRNITNGSQVEEDSE